MQLFLQQLANGVADGAQVSLLAVGYALIFNATREFHFAYGSVYMIAAWLLYAATASWGWAFVPAAFAAIGVAVALGVLIEGAFYAPLRPRSTRHIGVILTGLGLVLIIENIVVIFEGSEIRYPTNPVPGAQNVGGPGGVYLTNMQLIGIAAAPVVFVAMKIFLSRSTLGRSIRAVGANASLAHTVGVHAEHVRLWVYALGSGISALAAIVVAADIGYSPSMGFEAVLLATIAVIVGGIGSLAGAAIAGLVLGIAQNAGYLGIDLRWQNALAFSILMLVLLVRPQGLLGKPA
jgi:branched-subunit amino acid ABC-type transport system permease component